MTDTLPPGVFIGEMQAPFRWILIHAARFQGLIKVQAADGEGYVIVRKGEPMGCSFRQKGEDIRGKEAYSHITGFPVVNLNIYRYTPEEMDTAIRLVRSLGGLSDHAIRAPDQPVPGEPLGPQSEMPRKEAGGDAVARGAAAARAGMVPAPSTKNHTGAAETGEDIAVILPSGLDTVNLAHLLLGRMVRLPGVQAVSIFGRGTSVLSIGKVELDSLVVLAEDMLQAAKGISSVMRTGPFVHLTLQIPAGKVIIAPYFNEYLCILTTPDVNLGQIRKILKDIPSATDTGREPS